MRLTVEAMVRALEADEPLDAKTVTHISALGASLSEAGLGTEARAAVVRIVASQVEELVLEEAAAVASQNGTATEVAVRVLGSIVKRHGEVRCALQEAIGLTGARRDLSTDVREVCTQLLSGSWEDDESLQERASAVGIDLSHAWGAIVVTPAESTSDWEDLQASVVAFAAHQPGAVVAVARLAPAPHVVVLVPDRDGAWHRVRHAAAEAAIAEKVFMLCYDPIFPPRGLAGHYSRAVQQLGLPAAVSLRPRALGGAHLAFYGLCATAPIEARYELVDRTIGGLLRHRAAASLVDTLEAVFVTGTNPSELADRLRVHRNTVTRRLKAVTKLTGLGVERPEDLALLLVAVRLRHVVRP